MRRLYASGTSAGVNFLKPGVLGVCKQKSTLLSIYLHHTAALQNSFLHHYQFYLAYTSFLLVSCLKTATCTNNKATVPKNHVLLLSKSGAKHPQKS